MADTQTSSVDGYLAELEVAKHLANYIPESYIRRLVPSITDIDFCVIQDRKLIIIQCKYTKKNDHRLIQSFSWSAKKLGKAMGMKIKRKIWISKEKLSGISLDIAEEHDIKNILFSELDLLQKYIKPDEDQKITLRDYQEEAITEIIKGKTGFILLPTGCGKTVVALEALDRIASNKTTDLKAIWITEHKEVLVSQFHNKLRYKNLVLLNFTTSIFKQVKKHQFEGPQIHIFNTAYIKGHRDEYNLKDFDVIVIDECHNSGADGNYEFFNQLKKDNPNSMILGLSATPITGDTTHSSNTLKLFDNNALYEMNIFEARAKGLLCPMKYRLTNEVTIEKIIEVINESYNQKGIIWCERVEFAKKLHGDLSDALGEEYIIYLSYGDTDDLKTNDFMRDNERSIMVCVHHFREGFNDPKISFGIFAEAVYSHAVSVTIQTSGRVIRPFEKKKEAIILECIRIPDNIPEKKKSTFLDELILDKFLKLYQYYAAFYNDEKKKYLKSGLDLELSKTGVHIKAGKNIIFNFSFDYEIDFDKFTKEFRGKICDKINGKISYAQFCKKVQDYMKLDEYKDYPKNGETYKKYLSKKIDLPSNPDMVFKNERFTWPKTFGIKENVYSYRVAVKVVKEIKKRIKDNEEYKRLLSEKNINPIYQMIREIDHKEGKGSLPEDPAREYKKEFTTMENFLEVFQILS